MIDLLKYKKNLVSTYQIQLKQKNLSLSLIEKLITKEQIKMFKILKSLKTKIYFRYFDQVVNTPEAIQNAVDELSAVEVKHVEVISEPVVAEEIGDTPTKEVTPKKKAGRPKGSTTSVKKATPKSK